MPKSQPYVVYVLLTPSSEQGRKVLTDKSIYYKLGAYWVFLKLG